MDKAELADNWIKLQLLPQDSPQAEELMWAAEELNLLALRSPMECWKIILEIIPKTNEKWVLTNLAAGPLENLLALHAEETIAWLEQEVPRNAKLKTLLADVWKNLIPDDVWKRLQSLKSA